MISILDFQIRSISADKYGLTVFARGQSQPLATAEFDYPLSYMTKFELGSLEPNAKDPVGRFERLQKFGTQLYEKLFHEPKVLQVWKEHKEKNNFLVLCLRIDPKAAGLEALPWETLFDGDEFVAAGIKTGLSRLPLDILPQDNLPAIPLPLKMLALVSSPLDLPDESRLQIEREQEILLEAINTPAGQGRLFADFEDEANLEILEHSLESGYHLFHYAGHGIGPDDGGGLLLENAQGKSRPAPIADFLQSMQKGSHTLRLAVLSGCQTTRTLHTDDFPDLARGLIRQKLPAVIAMQFSISDSAGLLFARKLYPELAAAMPLEKGLSTARRALLRSDDPYVKADAFAPMLLTANGQCLHTIERTVAALTSAPAIDLSFHLMLPQLSFSFYGRRREYRQIRNGLIYENHRATIIHGLGGIGKTALISHTATRLRRHFKGVYSFDCSIGTLAPEDILLCLNRYFEIQGLNILQPLVNQSIPADTLGTYLGQALCQWPMLIIFDNFEHRLERTTKGFRIVNNDLRVFLSTLVKTTATGSRYLFASRYLIDIDDKRLGNIQQLPLGDLSRSEALSLMQNLPRLSAITFDEKNAAYEKFGGHPYALVALDRYCNHLPFAKALLDVSSLRAEFGKSLAIELGYGQLSDNARELLNRLAAFREPAPIEAAEWVMGKKVSIAEEWLSKIDRVKLPVEFQGMDDSTLLKILDGILPEVREAENLDKPINELIEWGLLNPVYSDGQLQSLAVHNLVRDFCRDQQLREIWRVHLQEAIAFYENQSKFDKQGFKKYYSPQDEVLYYAR